MPYYHMMDWFPFMGFGTVFAWLISLAVAYLVYKDAEKRNMNGLLWGLPILIPWIGILFLILYLILRDSGHRIAVDSNAPVKSNVDEMVEKSILVTEGIMDGADGRLCMAAATAWFFLRQWPNPLALL